MKADELTLEEKCRLLGGASTWRTHAIERAGIPALKLSDGPNGVRGDGVGTRSTPGLVIPVGIALGATWNVDLVRDLADVLGREAERKGAHVLLAPTVNLQRTPVGGRVFECLSEDPELTARLAVAYVRAVQEHDVAVTVKHFVVNDTEVERMTVDVHVDDAALRELYLRPFEAAVTEGGAWGVMSAYNKLRGEHCADNRWLLTEVLREEWGFDGFVVSDWYGSHDTVASAHAGLTVPMPGPRTIYGDALERAVNAGTVEEATVDRLVNQVITLATRTKAAERSSERAEETVDDPRERALCRRAVAEGAVLVRNDGVLPLDASRTVAVIGPNARDTRIMGGGSSSLEALPHRSVLDALEDRVASVVHAPGVRIDRLPPPLPERLLRTPDGEPGLFVEYRNGLSPEAEVVATDNAPSTMVRFFGSTPPAVDPARFHVAMVGSFVPEVSGPHRFSAVITGMGHVQVGDVRVLDDPNRSLPRGSMFFGLACEEQTAVVDCQAGVPVPVSLSGTGLGGFAGLRLGVRVPDPPDLLERAVAAAEQSDAAVVVVGTNDEWETEGEDRTTIALPGDQDELVRRVAAANPNTAVVVNAGSPVAMPWADRVGAVLLTYFGGNEMGDGVTDVLLGAADPGGRLPITCPRRLEDVPSWPHYAPVDGVQTYGEGLFMGYRGHDASGVEPLYPFGHGLSYGTADWGSPEVSAETVRAGEPVDVSVTVTATGERAATVVVQGYVSQVEPPVPRPPKSLACWQKLVVDPGDATRVTLQFPPTAFRRWDETADAWTIDPGRYELLLASSAADIRHRFPVTLT